MIFQNITVIGAGTIGSSWTTLFSMHGLKIIIFDAFPEALDRAKQNIRTNLENLIENDAFPASKLESTLALVTYTSDIKLALKDAEFVQAALPERYDLKKEYVAAFDQYASSTAIFASSTSGLLLSEICADSPNKDRILIAHPWNPPHLIPLIEICYPENCPDTNAKKAKKFYEGLNKMPIILKKEMLGHIGNRLQSAIYRETIDLVLSGVCTAEDVDKALTFGPGLRWGLFGQGLIFHLGGGPGGTREFTEKIGPSLNLWMADLADWKEIPAAWAEIGHKQVEEEIANRPPEIGNNVQSVKNYRDKMLLKLLKMHNKL